MRKLSKNQKGYALLELLFYISFFIALSLAVISAMVTMSRTFRETALFTSMVESSSIMERISREIRNAESINTVGATSLRLNTRDENDNLVVVEFSQSGTDMRLLENDILVGNLNAPDINVSTVLFSEITTTEGKAIKAYFAVSSDKDPAGRTFEFYDTVVLRGNY